MSKTSVQPCNLPSRTVTLQENLLSQAALTPSACETEENESLPPFHALYAPPTPLQPRQQLHPVCTSFPPLTSLRLGAGGGEGYKINDGANRVFIIRLESNATPF